MMLTRQAMDGHEAVGVDFANRAFRIADLERETLAMAESVAKIPTDVQQMYKRSLHCAMEVMGLRAAVRADTELQALALTTQSARAMFAQFRQSVRGALDARDGEFGDYRTEPKE